MPVGGFRNRSNAKCPARSVYQRKRNDSVVKSKNIRKDEGYYWVYAEVSTVLKDGKVVEYKSIRTPVSFENKKKYGML